jgi:sialic acid synthase SpsE/quercetin dioxygenase-like cupin family protein
MSKILIIFEMANNHMGDIEHGKLMIDKFSEISSEFNNYFEFAWKFQFRDLDTFIHDDFKNMTDHKYVKRFKETNLTPEQFNILKVYAEHKNFKTICTAFDEKSVSLIDKMNFSVVKVASCSFTDWPLLNKIVTLSKPIILSTAGSSLEDIDRVVSFMSNRNKDISLLHCVGEYPTQITNLQLNQIDILSDRYPNIKIGYSTHESPEEFDSIKIAIAKKAKIIEKHVAVKTEKYEPNSYSVTPDQMRNWLYSAQKSLQICGSTQGRPEVSKKETEDLTQFKRGMFVNKFIEKGNLIKKEDVYFAWPSIEGQILANNASKYNEIVALSDIEINKPVLFDDVSIKNSRQVILNIVSEIKDFIKNTNVIFPGKAELEISHHYGIEKFKQYGITMITVVNREYCKKLIIVLPNQTHPEQYHKEKEETFVILHGDVDLKLDGVVKTLTKGDVITIEKNVRHEFTTKTGCIIEEVSSTHFINDSYYTDESISKNNNRKTFVTYWI